MGKFKNPLGRSTSTIRCANIIKRRNACNIKIVKQNEFVLE